MKIIVSPSKMQHTHTTVTHPNKLPRNLEETLQLFEILRTYSPATLGRLMKLKGKLLDETYACYQHFDPTQPMICAIDCYTGVVFQEIQTLEYSAQQTSYMNDHLVVLSAMYGVLEPDTCIWPYRLDLTMKLAGIHLVQYWMKSVVDDLANEDVIINLASEEFNLLTKPLDARMLHVHFLERRADGALKVVSYNAKKARGGMAHRLITHQIRDVERMKDFVVDGYTYDAQKSDERNYFFIK
jgi:cytoplasmic iron level regulating protein YaaA (DUF328/UPF0246 family)